MKIPEIESFFNKEFTTSDLEKTINSLGNKKDFINERKFITTYHNKTGNDFSNYDVVQLSLFENQIMGIFNSKYTVSKNLNKSVSNNLNQVIQKMAFDVLRGEYKSSNELRKTIDTYCTGRNYNLDEKKLNQLVKEARKEYYYNSEESKKIPENAYNNIKSFNPERTRQIDVLMAEQVKDMIKSNQPFFQISVFYQKLQNYSTKKTPAFLTQKITAKNFDKALKNCINAQKTDSSAINSAKTLTQSARYLFNNMDKLEQDKLTLEFKKNKCTNEEKLALYLNNLITSKKSILATKLIKPKEQEYYRER